MTAHKILIVDDDETLRSVIAGELRQRGFDTSTADGVASGMNLLEQGDFDVAVVDLRLGTDSGLDLVRLVQEKHLRTELVVLTGHGSIDSAIAAMRAGAFDYLRKPCSVAELEVAIAKALERQRLIERNTILQDGLAPPDFTDDLVGVSREHTQVLELVARVAQSDSSVLILGETGVGKDRIAKLLHARSPRAAEPLVVVECAALHEELLNSELFGHEKGAYTGAVSTKHGLFEVADKGTIFLDEIGDVSPATQVKLLRVLEAGVFRRVGGTRELKVDVRVLAATNRDLPEMINRGFFRKDLFYRLNTVRIEVLPLRARRADIPALAEHFLGRMSARFGQERRFSKEALGALVAYAWPGNVRELLHVIERATIVATGEVIGVEQLPPEVRGAEAASSGDLSLAGLERSHIVAVLDQLGGNRNKAAAALGISERTLYRKLNEYGLDRDK